MLFPPKLFFRKLVNGSSSVTIPFVILLGTLPGARMLGTLPGARMATAQDTAPDLTHLSIEELMNVEIFSVARKTQKLFDTPAAAFVIKISITLARPAFRTCCGWCRAWQWLSTP